MTLHPGTIAQQTPDRLAVIIDDDLMTYGMLDQQSRGLAAKFHALGLRQGDVVAILCGNCPEFFAVAWAAQRSGLYYAPLPTRLTPGEIAYMLADSGARLFAVDAEYEALARQAAADLAIIVFDLGETEPPRIEPPAIEGADMLYTSGSTGRPKAVRRPITGQPLGSDTRRVERAATLFGMGRDTVFFTPAPLYHAAPLRFAMNLLRTGATVVGARRFEPHAALQTIAKRRITHSQWVPTMFVRMLALSPAERSAHDLSSHAVAIHGAAPCPPAIKHAMIDWWGPILHEYYSGTESIGFTHATSAEWLSRPGTVGRAYGAVIHVVDDDGNKLPPGTAGTICFEGASPLTYHNDPAKTAAAHVRNGWATMGDVGHVDDDGYLYLTDRRAFTIISGGVNIYPAEVEAAFMSHAAIVDIAVFGVPDDDLGEAVFALVEVIDGTPLDATMAARMRDHARQHLASFKLPRRIAFGTVGRTETGKLLKAVLKQRYAHADAGFDVSGAVAGARA